MKHIITSLLGLALCANASAQLPKWVIAPNYDQLSVKLDNSLLQTDSAGVTTLWTMDGRRLFTTPHKVHPFKDGVAVITKKDKNEIVGIVDKSGKFIAMPTIQVAYKHPYFEDGYLICNDKKGYSYYNLNGSKADFTSSVKSYPFHGGFAPFFTFDQPEKGKDPHYGYYRADGNKMAYRMIEKGEEKYVEPKNISFLSGIGANNRGVAVIKNKLYLFDPDTELFEPFLAGEGDSEKKRHLVLNGDYENYFLNLPTDVIEILAKYGNKQMALLQFDSQLRPVRFVLDGEEQTFEQPKQKAFEYSSDLKSYSADDKFGLASASRQLLPQQFEEVGLLYGNKAFVKFNGKWGLIEILPEISYKLQINEGEDVAFRHQKFRTQIRLDLPAEISATDARLDLPVSSGCVIDKISRETKDTESGNYVAYDCYLNIPDSLPDTMTTITYSPVSITYDGLRLFDAPIDIKAWHLKYYNVDPIDSETTVTDGVASFTINIDAQKNVGESDYPFEVKIEADSVIVQCEKLSETRYKYLVSNLQEGNNDLDILVTEKGCPPSIFPFDIYYTKPVPKKKVKEAVIVRKKSSLTPTSES